MIKSKSVIFKIVFWLLALSAAPAYANMAPVCQVTAASGYCRDGNKWSPEVKTPDVQLNNFGTFERPFSVNSLWNSRPRTVTFGSFSIPTSSYYPLIGTGPYSTQAFQTSVSDQPMTVYPLPGRTGIWNPDSEEQKAYITLPRWPAGTVGATGSDGHADIVDAQAGIIHSFWQLRFVNGKWAAEQYAWSRLDGRGWGDASHYFQGARAAGVSSMAGLIRKHEINDGASQYYHALAMSLDYSGLSKYHQYVFPATAGDRTWQQNTGGIPEGALVMLQPTFDELSISNPDLRKVVKTLKTFGAYIIDRNDGTPFYIYVENGADYNLHRGGWNSQVGNDLQRIREALREVSYAKDWVNGRGEPVLPPTPMNIASMRGPWTSLTTGGLVPRYDTFSQSVVFGPTDRQHTAENASGRSISNLSWMRPVPGRAYEFRVESTNGGRGYLRFWGAGAERFNTGKLTNGQTTRIIWPDHGGVAIMGAISGVGNQTIVRGTLTEIPINAN